MKTRNLAAIATVIANIFMAGIAQAQNGNWGFDRGGNWGDATNWVGDVIADGADNTATLNNVITADRTITLDSARTIGNITASDTTHNYTIGGANSLTLDVTSGSPAISVPSARALTITSPLTGVDGLAKGGAGTLLLNANNSFSGGVTISAGTLQVSSATHTNSFGNATNMVTFTGTSTLYNSNGAFTMNQGITANSGVTATLSGAFGESLTVKGPVTGDGTLVIDGASNGWAVDLNNTTSSITGKIQISGNSGTATLTMKSLADSANPIALGRPAAANAAGLFTYNGNVALTLVSRAIQLSGSTSAGTFNSSGSGVVTINKNLGITGTGNKTFTLGGGNTGANTFAGNITNGVGSVISLTKADGGRWILSGTNTFTGGTYCNTGSGILVFQGAQSAPSGRTITLNQSSSSSSAVRLLADGEGTNTFPATIAFDNRNPTTQLGFLVGNTSSANGGTGGGTTTGATIAVNKFSFIAAQGAAGGLNGPAAITINNGYTLNIGAVQFAAVANIVPNWKCQLVPAGGAVKVTGTVQQDNGNTTSENVMFTLDGSSTGNEISGAIKDAADYPSNASAMPLSITKSGASTWTLSGANTFSGTTTVSGGRLVLAASTCLSDTNLLSIAGTGANKVVLNDGVKEVVGLLKTNNVTVASGTYGSLSSAAENKTDTYFSGTGVLYVGVPVPASGTLVTIY